MLAGKHLLLWFVIPSVLSVVNGHVLLEPVKRAGQIFETEYLEARSDLESRNATATSVPLRIMPLGASITFGTASTDGNGYRKVLRDKIVALGTQVNMVGSHPNGTMVDNDNEGWPGYIIDEVHTVANTTVPQYEPNLVLINVGTNDCTRNIDIPNASARMASMLQDIYKMSPNVTIILSTLIPNVDAASQERVEQVNTQYRTLVTQLKNKGKPIVVAEMQPGLTVNDISSDGTHPTDQGYLKMSVIWSRAIVEASARGMLRRAADNGLPDDGA